VRQLNTEHANQSATMSFHSRLRKEDVVRRFVGESGELMLPGADEDIATIVTGR